MPYPVLPPALPPVVNVVLPEESKSPSSLDSASVDIAQARSISPSPNCALDCESVLSPSEASSEANVKGSEANSLEGASTATLLGEPITVELPQSNAELRVKLNRESPSVSEPEPVQSARPTTFLQLPDLDALREARRQPPRPARDSRSNRSTPSILAQGVQPSSDPTDQPGQTPGDSIRLDFPTSEPTETSTPVEPSQPDNLENSNPSDNSDTPTNQQSAPSNNAIPPLTNPTAPPIPVPQPSDGQILTIPTPSRTRQEGEGAEGTQPTPQTDPQTDQTAPQPNSQTPRNRRRNNNAIPIDPLQVGEVLEVKGDRQEFDERQQVFSAEGNVQVRFRQAVLTANRVRVNIPNRVAVAEGNAVLSRGDQVLRGEQFTYNFGLNQGSVRTARGELLIPAAARDLDPNPTPEVGTTGINQPVTQRVSSAQPLQVITGTPGPSFGFGNRSQQTGNLNRLRFEADQAQFDGSGLVADNVRITNDPFSPPELELRSNRVTYTRLSPTQAEIRARNPRLVFDQGFTLPLLVNRLVIDNRKRDPGLLNFGYDEKDRDGFYIERSFDLYSSPLVSFSLTPQILIQRAIQGGQFDGSAFGLVAAADFQFSPTTTAQAVASFSSLDFSEIQDNLRASVRGQQRVLNHTVALEYSYRNRLFNGSLGFQDIQSSIGIVVASPRYVLGNSLINLNYQAGVQYVNAQTDQQDLYDSDNPDRDKSCIDPDDRDTTNNGCTDLTRYQAAVSLNRFFLLWAGTALPQTPTEGLRYSPTPIVPYLGIYLEGRGVYSAYSNGDIQASLRGGISLLGQFGHFSKPLFDYTAFSFGYYNTLKSGESPFLFDRIGDEEFIVASVTQQIYGPLRFGVQLSYNLQTADEIDTVYSLEYSRRTYSISASYSTGREAAAITFRLNDFNWTGDPGPFSGLGSNTVENGVIQGNN